MIPISNRSIFRNFEDGAELLSLCKEIFAKDLAALENGDVANVDNYDVHSALQAFCFKTSNKYESDDVRRRIELFITSRCFAPVVPPAQHIRRSYRPRSDSITREHAKIIKDICSTKSASCRDYIEIREEIIKEFEEVLKEKKESHSYTEDKLLSYINRYGKVHRTNPALPDEYSILNFEHSDSVTPLPQTFSYMSASNRESPSSIDDKVGLMKLPTKRHRKVLNDLFHSKVAKATHSSITEMLNNEADAFDPEDSEWKAFIKRNIDSAGLDF